VKEVAELHRAELTIDAGTDGIGTRIRMTWPQPPADLLRTPLARASSS